MTKRPVKKISVDVENSDPFATAAPVRSVEPEKWFKGGRLVESCIHIRDRIASFVAEHGSLFTEADLLPFCKHLANTVGLRVAALSASTLLLLNRDGLAVATCSISHPVGRGLELDKIVAGDGSLIWSS
jgi:hypothetical protein